ncbi:MAG: 1-acyl-sn-glycerol-3-phosphate acyltransferase [Burkholderiaceae bacterium]|nr:MAG: 1-acyl-sn-glycerol-3-phosphate acyltransferase [Burkholderiaceae bacterium]
MKAFVLRFWHVLVVRVCFLLFAINGLLLSWLWVPALRLLPGGKSARIRRARAIVRTSFRILVRVLEGTGVMRLEVTGREHLQNCGGQIVLANHPTYIDAVVLQSMIPFCNCIVKSALWDGLSYGNVLRAAHFIRNDKPETLISDGAAVLRAGEPLLVFPEGTRTELGGEVKFLRGAAHIILATQAPIIPVILRCTPPALSKSHRWYQVPSETFVIRVEILPACFSGTFVEDGNPDNMKPRGLTAGLEKFFKQRLHGN